MQYILLAIASVLATLGAYLLNWFFALFVQRDGNLPQWLSWFQPSDNPATGDRRWHEEHPYDTPYELAVSFMNRNPAQGFDQLCKADVTEETPYTIRGNINIKDEDNGVGGWYYITAGEYWHFAYVWKIPFMNRCATGGFGWRLISLAKGYSHPTLGQLVFTPARFQKFKGG